MHPNRKTSRSNKRIVFKNGEINIEKSFTKKFRLSNWFIMMVEARWRWTLINFFLAFTLDWMLFGFVYWIIAWRHEDLLDHNLQSVNDTWVPCVEHIYGFTSSFLFSIEVHTTVAYGRRSITLECPQAILAMCLQCILSSIFQAFLVGILFAKLTRPKNRAQTILFSKHAVVNSRDEQLCLVFRVGDMRKSRILNIKVAAYVLKTNDNDVFVDSNEQINLKTEIEGCESTFFLWPLSVVHVIDERSPLYKISAADLLCGSLEILVVFEGVIETTGQPVQAKSSYAKLDILWGHRFVPMMRYDYDREMYDVDFSKLGTTEQVDTPLCSAEECKNAVWAMQCFNGIIEEI